MMSLLGHVGHINYLWSSRQSECISTRMVIYSSRVVVGPLMHDTTSEELARVCSKSANVIQAKVLYDHERKGPLGFGFVDFSSNKEASKAIQLMNGHRFDNDKKKRLISMKDVTEWCIGTANYKIGDPYPFLKDKLSVVQVDGSLSFGVNEEFCVSTGFGALAFNEEGILFAKYGSLKPLVSPAAIEWYSVYQSLLSGEQLNIGRLLLLNVRLEVVDALNELYIAEVVPSRILKQFKKDEIGEDGMEELIKKVHYMIRRLPRFLAQHASRKDLLFTHLLAKCTHETFYRHSGRRDYERKLKLLAKDKSLTGDLYEEVDFTYILQKYCWNLEDLRGL